MADDKEIRVRVDNYLMNDTSDDDESSEVPKSKGSSKGSNKQIPDKRSSGSYFAGALSADMFVAASSELLNAAGNQKIGGAISRGAEWTFLVGRGAMGDIPSLVTIPIKLAALGLEKWREHEEKLKEIASRQNDLMMMKMRSGQIVISANTRTSYSKHGKITLTDRK